MNVTCFVSLRIFKRRQSNLKKHKKHKNTRQDKTHGKAITKTKIPGLIESEEQRQITGFLESEEQRQIPGFLENALTSTQM
jgi:hypothetical protein